MQKIGRVLAAVAIAVGLVGFAHVNASPAEACTYFIRLREDSGGAGDSRTWCKDTVLVYGQNDLNTITHTQAGYCNSNALYRAGDDWDDCASSVDFYLPTDKCVVFFNDPNGGGPVTKSRRGTGTNYTISNFSQAGNDKTTSFYFGNFNGTGADTCRISPAAPEPVADNYYPVPYDQ